MSQTQHNENRGRSLLEYQRRVAIIKNDVIELSERNMENTLWVIRRWLNNEMSLINIKK